MSHTVELTLTEKQAFELNRLGINQKLYNDTEVLSHIIEKVTEKLSENDLDDLKKLGIL